MKDDNDGNSKTPDPKFVKIKPNPSSRRKEEVSALLRDLEGVLHNAIDTNIAGNLNVYEMVAVAANTLLERFQRGAKTTVPKKPANVAKTNNVVPFRKKEPSTTLPQGDGNGKS